MNLIKPDWGSYNVPEYHRAHISPDDAGNEAFELPAPARSFLDSKAGLAFRTPKPCQQRMWPLLLSGSDVICVVSNSPKCEFT